MRARLRRRDLLLAAAALPLAAGSARAATASREFRILRSGSDIGRHRLDARHMPGGDFEVRIFIDIAVKLLGLTAYSYRLENVETWRQGRIVAVRSRVDDDGERHYASIAAGADGLLEIDGSGYSGTAPAEAVTTSYYAPAFLDRRPWISTQSGRALAVSVSPSGPRRWQVAGELTTELFYDAAGEWVGCAFDAGGEPARYEPSGGSGGIAALWAAA